MAAVGGALLLAGCVAPRASAPTSWPVYQLSAAQTVQLNLPASGRFDASGLLITPAGDLLSVSDRGPTLYRIELLPDGGTANLIPLTNCFTAAQLAPFSSMRRTHYDCEGIAQDVEGRLYLCE